MNNIYRLMSILALAFVCCPFASAADYATFESFYESGGLSPWAWIVIVTGTVIAAVIAYFTCGTAVAVAPTWFATIGGWIGSWAGYSGAAAVNYGMAVLGGGTIAAGGFGIAGGAALLSTIGTFSVEVATAYSVDAATEMWHKSKFQELNRNMVTLPVLRNKDGGKAYESAVAYLLDNYITKGEEAETKMSSARNQEVLAEAIKIMQHKMSDETDKDYKLKDKVLLSLLYLQTNRYTEAEQTAHEAVVLATQTKESPTLPSFIRALAELSSPEKECTRETLQALRTAYHEENKNYLMLIMTGSCMDRMMYKYHYGRLSIDNLSEFCDIITYESINENMAAGSLSIFITRCLVELKRTQQDILVIVEKEPELAKRADVAQVLRDSYDRHEQLLAMMQKVVLGKLNTFADEFEDLREKAEEVAVDVAEEQAEKEAKKNNMSKEAAKKAEEMAVAAARKKANEDAISEAKLKKLLEQYKDALPDLRRKIEEACATEGTSAIEPAGEDEPKEES